MAMITLTVVHGNGSMVAYIRLSVYTYLAYLIQTLLDPQEFLLDLRNDKDPMVIAMTTIAGLSVQDTGNYLFRSIQGLWWHEIA